MSLTLTEKVYWKNRIATWVKERRDADLLDKGQNINTVNIAIAATIEATVGVDVLGTELIILQEEAKRLDAEIREKAKKIKQTWYDYAKSNDLLVSSAYYAESDVVKFLKPSISEKVTKRLDVYEIMNRSDKMACEISDAIMLSTTSAKLRSFVSKIMKRFGISGEEDSFISMLTEE